MACSWLEAEVDAALEVPAADEGISLEALISTAGNTSADIAVLGEGVSVGHGKWPLDKCASCPTRCFHANSTKQLPISTANHYM